MTRIYDERPIYCVYEYIRLDTMETFYYGKGTMKRAMDWKRDRNNHFRNTINKVGIENIAVVILHKRLKEKIALEYEVYYICTDRYECGNKLTNQTDGGDGISGYTHTEESRKKIGESTKKVWLDPEHRKKKIESLKGVNSKPVVIFKNGEYLNEFPSISALAKVIGKGTAYRLADGYKPPEKSKWRGLSVIYKEDYERYLDDNINLQDVLYKKEKDKKKQTNGRKEIYVYKDNQFYGRYDSATELAIKLSTKKSEVQSIWNALRKLARGWEPTRGQWIGWKVYDKNKYEKLQEDQLQKIS